MSFYKQLHVILVREMQLRHRKMGGKNSNPKNNVEGKKEKEKKRNKQTNHNI